MTDALVACLHALLHTLPHGAVALVAMEKRINFCLASLTACAPAVEHFAQGLEAEYPVSEKDTSDFGVPVLSSHM